MSPAAVPRGRIRELADDVRALPREAWVVYAGTFINRFGSFVLTFLVLILTRRGLTPARAGLAASAYGVGSLGAAAVGGHLADRIGRRRTIALSMFSSAVAMLALWRAEALPAVTACTALAGFCAEMYRPAAGALLADVTPRGRRVGAFALYRMAINLGFSLGPATIGFFAARSTAVVFVGDAVTSALYGVLILAAIPASADRGAGRAVAKRDGPSAVRLMLRDGVLMAFLAAVTLMWFVHHQDMAALPLEIGARGYTTAQYGVLISLNGLGCMLLELPVASITARLPPWIPLAAGAAFVGAGMAATGLAHGLAALVLTVALWTLGEVTAAPVTQAFVADLAPPGLQGRYQGTLSFTTGLAFIFAPGLGGWLFGWSRPALWITCGASGLVAALVFVAIGRVRNARTVAAELASLAVAE